MRPIRSTASTRNSPRRFRANSRRQEEHIELIGSENFASPRVLAAQGSVLTNKYAEGYPGRRYYGGCEFVDIAERLAIERAKSLFGADFANVQPHSGSPGQRRGLPGDDGARRHPARHEPAPRRAPHARGEGEFSPAGSSTRFSMASIPPAGRSTTTRWRGSPREHRPKVVVAGFSAYSRVVDWQRFRDIADEVGAWLLVGHGPRGGPDRRRHLPEPGARRRRDHHHDSQDPARSAGRADSGAGEPGTDQEDQLQCLPLHPGRAADARDRRQGGGPRRGRSAGVPGPTSRRSWRTPAAWRAR